MTLKTDLLTDDYSTYAYDHRNRLEEVTWFNSLGQQQYQVSYVYDGSSRRIRTDDNGLITHYYYDGLNPILKLTDGGSVNARRLYRRFVDTILAEDGAGETRWFVTDQVGTVRDLIADDASLINHYVYDSFGQLLDQTSPTVANDLLFNAREFLSTTPMGYYRARFVDPRIGRFVGEDIFEPFRYEYANNNPLAFVDPLGEAALAQYKVIISNIGLRLAIDPATHPFKFWLIGVFRCIHFQLTWWQVGVKGSHRNIYIPIVPLCRR